MKQGHLFLIGFMGSGKSTVACLVADRLGIPCIDLDAVVEQQQGMDVARIFETRGEDGFRELETKALLDLEQMPSAVVACGGGVVVRPQNRTALGRLGTVVYLRVSAAEALARVGDTSTRPLLSGAGGPIAATALLSARESLYASVSDLEVDTVGRTPDQVADLVLAAIEESR